MIELVGGQLYQWETGRTVSGFTGNVSQFANAGDSIAMSITVENGGSVRIPDRYLSTGKNLVVYDVQTGNDDEETVVSVKVFPVKAKAKPKNYAPTAAEEAYGIVKKLTDEAKAAAVVAEGHSNKAGECADEAAQEAAEATNQAGMAESYAKRAEAAAKKLEPLIVTTHEGSYAASSNAEDIWDAVAAGRDVILEIRAYGGPEDCSAPIMFAAEDQAIFAVVDAGNLLLFAVNTDGEITRTTYPLSRYAILDDKSTYSLSTWSSVKILAMIAQGGTGDIDMGDGRAVICGSVSAHEFRVADSVSEGFYVTSDLAGGDYDKPIAAFYGTHGDQPVVLRHIAPGTNDLDAVNKEQLDAVEATANSKAKIDNTAVGADAWSSLNTVDKLCPSLEESGTVIRCNPMAGTELKVSAKEVPGVYDVTICGKNLYDKNAYPMKANTIIRHATGNMQWSGVFSGTEKYIPCTHLRSETISIRHAPRVTQNDDNTGGGIAFYDRDQNYISGTNQAVAVVPKDAWFMRFSINMQYASWAQIELGSSVTDHEEYTVHGTGVLTEPDSVVKITAGSGVHTIFAVGQYDPTDVGDITVTGKSDPSAIIKEQGQEIKALRNAIVSLGSNV